MAATRRSKYAEIPPEYASEDGGFRRGFDARYATDLISVVLRLDNPGALRQFSRTEAKRRIRAMGWEHLLEFRSRAARNQPDGVEGHRNRR